MTTDADRQRIRDFISGHVHGLDFEDDEDLFAGGLVNSLFAMQLVLWLERSYGIQVQGDDLDFANFAGVDAVAAFLDRKLTATKGAAWTAN